MPNPPESFARARTGPSSPIEALAAASRTDCRSGNDVGCPDIPELGGLMAEEKLIDRKECKIGQ